MVAGARILARVLGNLSLLLLLGQGGPAAAACLAGQSQLYPELFVEAQRALPDAKSLVDAIPNQPSAAITAEYLYAREQPGFDLQAFLARQFVLPHASENTYRADPSRDVRDHIDALWSVLERTPQPADARGSLLPLPRPYVVPVAASTRSITGIRTSPCWGWRRAGVTIWSSTWWTTSHG